MLDRSFHLDRERLAFGCCPLGGYGWGAVDVDEIMRAVRVARSRGITIFDTADVYGFGQSETRLADALGDDRRNATIVTKVGLRWHGANKTVVRDGSPSYLRSAVVQSARRLRLESIPIVLLHWPDPLVAISESLGALADLQNDGLVGAYGASNLICDNSANAIHWSQLHVSLLTIPPPEATWGVRGTMAWGTLEQGLLAGKYRDPNRLDVGDRRLKLPLWTAAALRAIEPLRRLLRDIGLETGFTSTQLAVLWVLSCTPVTTAVVGFRSVAQLEEMLDVGGNTVAEEALTRLTVAAASARSSLMLLMHR